MLNCTAVAPMNVETLQSHLSQLRLHKPIDVVIPVKKLFATIGGQPSVNVTTISAGFDWDAGKLFLNPEKPLMLYEDYTDAPETIRNLQKEVGNLQYEMMGYKAQIKTLKRKLKELENAKSNTD